ncbi:MAG: glycosyltransferase family 39 protein [Acidobacteriota bacterium]
MSKMRIRIGSRLVTVMLLVTLTIAFSLYSAMVTPDRFGDYYDDGIYVTAAKALATGQGYRIISLPHEKPQTQVPPFYPFLLSLIWRAYPEFPQNLALMMMLSVIATVSFLALSYRYLVKQNYATHWQALIIVSFAAINWRTMLHASSVMSDVMYALLSVCALYFAERYEKERKSWVTGVGAGAAIGLAFLTRSSGITLLVAVAVYYALRRQWKRALLPLAVAILFVLAWVGWSFVNRNTPEGVNAIYHSNYLRGYGRIISDLQAQNNTSLLMTLLNVVETNILLLIIGSIPLACLGLRYDLPQIVLVSLVLITVILIATGFVRQCRKSIRLLYVYLSFYLAIYLILPGTAYDRYVMPIVPFLLLFLVSELARPASVLAREMMSGKHLARKVSAAFIALALIAAIGVSIFSNVSAIYDSLGSLKRIASRASEKAEAIEWIKSHTDPSDILICNNDPAYYLYIGRKATISFDVSVLDTLPYQSHQPDFGELTQSFLDIINENNGRYLILNESDLIDLSARYQKSIEEFIEQRPQKFVPVFESTNRNSIIYRVENNTD